MKAKHILIVSLILAILTIGAVSASQNPSVDDSSQMAIDEAAAQDDALAESDEEEVSSVDDSDNASLENDDEIIGASEDSQELLGDYYNDKIHISIDDTVNLGYVYSTLGCVEDEGGIKGSISVSIDGKKVLSKKFTSGSDTYHYIYAKDVNLKKFGYGYHKVKITYNGKSDYRKVNVVRIPYISHPSVMAVGQTNYILIRGVAGMTGTATVYERNAVGKNEQNDTIYKRGAKIVTLEIKNGKTDIPIKFLKDGYQGITLEYKIGTYEDYHNYYIEVKNNTAGYKASLSPKKTTVGKSVTLKMTGPKSSSYVTIEVDGKYLKDVKFSSGAMKEVISGLSKGTHYITVQLYKYDSNTFYSNTFKVVIKDNVKLALKKVAVKKSAKKLVLTAKLKINKKTYKGKKLTFKFNNKKYTAKTNKKGVAKVTIKKSALKKLKVGSKVKYQVAYGKVIRKLAAKVKK